MADVKKLAPFIQRWEGGFVDDPDDLGGATNMGVTIATYKVYRKRKGLSEPTVDDLKHLSNNEWIDILKSLYWDKWKADQIKSQSVANILVDWVWASGRSGITRVQQLLQIKVDGIVGPQTVASINLANQRQLFETIKADRIRFIEEICKRDPSQVVFRKGWLNRINDFKFSVH